MVWKVINNIFQEREGRSLRVTRKVNDEVTHQGMTQFVWDKSGECWEWNLDGELFGMDCLTEIGCAELNKVENTLEIDIPDFEGTVTWVIEIG